ncbi:MAG: hypothetical protein R6V77_01700 [Candidatus Cloacimonadaceae bacterium]
MLKREFVLILLASVFVFGSITVAWAADPYANPANEPVSISEDNALTEQNMREETSQQPDNNFAKASAFFGKPLGIILLIIVFLILIVLPFIPAFRELLNPKDNKPLFINQDYIRDPKFFDKHFMEELKPYLVSAEAAKSGSVKFRNQVPIDYHKDLSITDSTKTGHFLIVNNNLKTGSRAVFNQPVYVQGDAEIGSNNQLDILKVNGNIKLGKESSINKWVSSDGSINASEDVQMGKRATCNNVMQMKKGCKFSNLYAMPIATYEANFNQTQDSVPPVELPDGTIDSSKQVTDFNWYISKSFMSVPPYSVVNSSMIVKSDLVIRQGVVVNGDIKVYGNLVIEKGVRIYGELVCEKDVVVGEDSFIRENLFSQSQIHLKSGVRIGMPGKYKTAIGKKGIKLEKNVLVYGSLMTAGQGIVV